MCPGTLAEENEDGREDEEDKDGGGGGSFGGDGALWFMGVESPVSLSKSTARHADTS